MILMNNEKLSRNYTNPKFQEEINKVYSRYGDCDSFFEKIEEIKCKVLELGENVYFLPAPTLELLKEAYGLRFLLRLLSLQIIEINTSSNVPTKMTTGQINDFAKMLVSDHKNLKITEFIFFIKQCKNAEFGNFFATIDPHLVKGWFRNVFIPSKNHKVFEYQRKKQDELKRKAREENAQHCVTREQYLELLAKGIYKPKLK